MRTTVEITGVLASGLDVNTFKAVLEHIGVSKINIKNLPQFDEWRDSLPTESIPDLSDACLDWIHSWGNGGGDYSTETCITSAIRELKSDVPAELADAIFDSVLGYSKSEFDAIGLTVEMIDGSINELRVAANKREDS